MRYLAKELKDNVNISRKNPLKELASLVISLVGILLIIYIGLGFAVDFIAPRLPENIEQRLGQFFTASYARQKRLTPVEEKVQALLDDLSRYLPVPRKYKVYIVENKEVNAFALPGETILMFSGLLEEVKSENELSFVLAHELGHFANRDHLRGLGRGLVFFVISSVFLGQDSSVNQFLGNSLTNAEMKFSQAQERTADLFGLDLVQKKYKHAGGAVEFIQKIRKKEKAPQFLYFFATHPHSEKRLQAVKQRISSLNYPIKALIPLDPSLQQPHQPETKD